MKELSPEDTFHAQISRVVTWIFFQIPGVSEPKDRITVFLTL